MSKKIKIPKFKNEDEERKFWSKIDLSNYFEADDFKSVLFGNLGLDKCVGRGKS